MAISSLYAHYFELLNFLFIAACITYLYKKYGSPLLAQAIKTKKDAQRELQQQIATTKQQIAAVDQAVAEQEQHGTHLITKLTLWSKKEEEKKERVRQECLLLKQQLIAYNSAQKKAVALYDIQQELLPEVLIDLRKQLTAQYQSAHQQTKAVQDACNALAQGAR